MEVVAAAASVTGIVALSGECLSAALKIRNLYSDVTWASKDIDSFVRKIDSLSKVLEGVKEICASIQSTESSSRPSFNIAGLQIQVEDCAKDLNQWLKIGQKLHPTKWPEGPERGTLATFRKFKAAVDKLSVKNMQEKLASSERGINSCLAVIGRQLDLQNSQALRKIDSKITTTRSVSAQVLSQVESTSTIVTDVASCVGSIQSASVASSERIERIESTSARNAEMLGRLLERAEHSTSRLFCQCNPRKPNSSNSARPMASITDLTSGFIDPIPLTSSSAPATTAHQLTTAGTERRSIQAPIDVQDTSSFEGRRNQRTKESDDEAMRVLRQQKQRDQGERIAELEHELLKLRNGCPTWQAVLHHQLTTILDETTSRLPEQVAEYFCYWLMFHMTKSLREFCIMHSPEFPGASLWGGMKIAAHMLNVRRKCVQEGYDRFSLPRHPCWARCFTNGELEWAGATEDNFDEILELSMNKDDDQTTEYRSSLDWTTTRDRINGWLLDCLQSSETLIQNHKGLLNDSSLDHEEWARLVLKYWSLDEAASGSACEPYPTDGAVGSEGGRHTARVTVTSVKITGMKRANKASCSESEQESRPAKLRKIVEDPPPDDPLSWN